MKVSTLFIVTVPLIISTFLANAQIPLMEIATASAPNVLRSPNAGTWKNAAANWLENKTGTGNSATNPAAFSVSSVISASDLMVVPSDSQTHLWHGELNPSGTLTAGEFGNRLWFGFSVKSTLPFRMSNIRCTIVCTDSRFNNSEMLSPYVYNSFTVGVSYGPNGVKGGGDDTRPGNGASATTLVNELYYGGGILVGAYGVRNTNDIAAIETYVGNQSPAFYAQLKIELMNDSGTIIGVATKKIATVPIIPSQPSITLQGQSGGQFLFSLTGESERTYTLQTAPSIQGTAAATGWTDIATLWAGPTGSTNVTLGSSSVMKYFRLKTSQ